MKFGCPNDENRKKLLGRFSGQIEGFEVFDVRQLNPVNAKLLEIDADKAVEGEVYVKMNDADWNELGFIFISCFRHFLGDKKLIA